ncbi:hypothetical protein [Tumebacillus sp. BK434]|uniref:hypothetical protein n=1 Tax=Tumebacillus sp. BK434 TaxID=2512169 RepID=UPI001047E321|nr:hypothetical protein [Tumebacillus sp. BK434]
MAEDNEGLETNKIELLDKSFQKRNMHRTSSLWTFKKVFVLAAVGHTVIMTNSVQIRVLVGGAPFEQVWITITMQLSRIVQRVLITLGISMQDLLCRPDQRVKSPPGQ